MTIHLPKLNGVGGGNGGGGSAKFPTIVTDSGSSLPVDLTGYQENDTFLNTTDKKIYNAEETITGYTLNNDVTNYASIDLSSGIANNFNTKGTSPYVGGSIIYKETTSSSFVWKGNKDYNVHFIMGEKTSNKIYGIFYVGASLTTGWNKIGFYIKNNQLCYKQSSSSSGSVYVYDTKEILTYDFSINKEYFLKIEKRDDNCHIYLYENGYNGLLLADAIFSCTSDITPNTLGIYCLAYGTTCGSTAPEDFTGTGIYFANGSIYLADSTGDFVTPTIALTWDTGTSLIDKTEVADKTNGILYLYKDDELVNIPQKNTLLFTNVSASSWVADSTYTDYGYKCELSCSGVTSSMFAQVIFAQTDADSGNYATVCQTGSNTVTIYSKVNDTITIPSIVVMGV